MQSSYYQGALSPATRMRFCSFNLHCQSPLSVSTTVHFRLVFGFIVNSLVHLFLRNNVFFFLQLRVLKSSVKNVFSNLKKKRTRFIYQQKYDSIITRAKVILK